MSGCWAWSVSLERGWGDASNHRPGLWESIERCLSVCIELPRRTAPRTLPNCPGLDATEMTEPISRLVAAVAASNQPRSRRSPRPPACYGIPAYSTLRLLLCRMQASSVGRRETLAMDDAQSSRPTPTSRLLCAAGASVSRPRDLALGPRPERLPRGFTRDDRVRSESGNSLGPLQFRDGGCAGGQRPWGREASDRWF